MTSKRPAKKRGATDDTNPRPDAENAAQGPSDASATPSELTSAPTFRPRGLTPLQQRFAQEYLIDLNGVKAYQRASPDASYGTAGNEAYELLRDPVVGREIQRLMDERATVTGITADRVLFKLWEKATADARELIEYRIGSCRHCWGIYNQYQYTDAEFANAQDKHIREQADKAKKAKGVYEPVPFPEKGGCGYQHDRPPNPECPECWGRGEGMPLLHDTRHYSDGAKALYAGIKITKDGVNVQMHNPVEALQLIGRHLGMWNDKIKLGDTENPLYALIQEIQQQHSTVAIVADDPERRVPGNQVQDVVAKAPKSDAPGASSQRKPGKTAGWKAIKT